jgi:hypothetical protein
VAVDHAPGRSTNEESFDASSGQLVIRPAAGEQTVREAITADGFLDVTMAGQKHSSNPRSASFDRALAGATGSTVAGIDFAGGGQDTLILASQQLAGSMTVQATGATVVTENVATAGPLAIQADNITVTGALQDGSVSLAASGWVTMNAAGRIDAVPALGRPSDPSTIALSADVFVNSGQLHANGPAGGQINVQARNILNAGPITANGAAVGGAGGRVRIAFTGAYVATTAAVVSADSAAGPGGHLTIDGGSAGHLFTSGRHQAMGSVGGAVDLLGRDIILSAATVDASGQAGGGSVRIGGDFNDSQPAGQNAQTVTVTAASTIRADDQQSGSGGQVLVWSEQSTAFDGAVSVRGGPAGGAGGFIDVSGHGDLSYRGSADAGARRGKSGTLLLDPKNIIISDAPAGVFPQFALIDPHPTPGFGTQVSVLRNGNIVVTNPFDDFGGMNAGAVYLFDGLSGGMISALLGSHIDDRIGQQGFLNSVFLLSNSNYVVGSSRWNGNRGAVTWGNGSTGISGTVSDANSLVGSDPGDGYIPPVGYAAPVVALSNGDYVVDDPVWHANRGAVTWGDGSTGVSGTISEANSLVGSNPNDGVGWYVYALSNGNYVVNSPNWNSDRGAVTWGNGTTGISGTISGANSLVGSNPGDGYSNGYADFVIELSNGNYVVGARQWNGNRGAATWASGSTGVSGTVSDTNSLVGSSPGDMVGLAFALSNGNYVIDSPKWNGNRGAVTWSSGSTGVTGTISDINSVVGSNPGDYVGASYVRPSDGYAYPGFTSLPNGNYVVNSPDWNSNRGAVTWGNGSTGISGTISGANSLVGSNAQDYVGGGPYGGGVTLLSNGNYVVASPSWNVLSGAATWGNGSTGISGTVSAANSLVGDGGALAGSLITSLSNGNYLVQSPGWNGNRGAVTWGNGSTGIRGSICDTNSLVGSGPGDVVGVAFALSNGNYVVDAPLWNGHRGAVAWGNGNGGTVGTVSAANSLVGSNPEDLVGGYLGQFGIELNPPIALSNGSYVVDSPDWNGYRGAASWGDGSMGTSGMVSAANSLIGSNPGDVVGQTVALRNGNYVVDSPHWSANRGAVTWGNSNTGVSGTISEANSLAGSNPGTLDGDQVGRDGITALSNGSYVVKSSFWNHGRGAVTWGNGSAGVSGTISDSNSIVGSSPGDFVGYNGTPLSDGNYVAYTPGWNGQRGAATWMSGTSGETLDGLGPVTPQNSLIGSAPRVNGNVSIIDNPTERTFLASFGTGFGGQLTAGFTDPSQVTYARAQSQSLSILRGLISRTLDAGTAVVLQASNDITVNSPIAVSAGGHGGALTLQAGRSIVLSAPITTDNGALTLIANDQLSDGVVDAERDPGNAVISMASGTALDTGSGPLTVELRDGAGLTNSDSGAITLQTVTAGSVAVVNNGPSPGSDVLLGPVTTSGPQSYGSPNGTTMVTGDLTAIDSPITFNHSVVLNTGITLSAGASTVNFASGSVLPSPGVAAIAGGVVLTGSTTFSATLNGTDPGSYSQLTVGGPIDLGSSALNLTLGFEPPVGSTFEIITNTGSTPITGTFSGLAEGAIFTQGGYQFEITYQGGTGDDSVVLTRVL